MRSMPTALALALLLIVAGLAHDHLVTAGDASIAEVRVEVDVARESRSGLSVQLFFGPGPNRLDID